MYLYLTIFPFMPVDTHNSLYARRHRCGCERTHIALQEQT